MTKRDIAGFLGVDIKTLYNWEKNRPNLYKTVMKGLAVDEAIRISRDNYEKISELAKNIEKDMNIKTCLTDDGSPKMSFFEEKEAIKATKEAKSNFNIDVKSYECKDCGLWHLRVK